MPRVIAGTHGGRQLRVPPSARPTVDRVKEAVFSSLGPMGARVVLDAYAGSGALGIEALSRGAAHAIFVEQDRKAAATVRANLETLGLASQATVIDQAIERAIQGGLGAQDGASWGLTHLLLDPPYALPIGDIDAVVRLIQKTSHLAPGYRIMLERDKRHLDGDLTSVALTKTKSYGDTIIQYYEEP